MFLKINNLLTPLELSTIFYHDDGSISVQSPSSRIIAKDEVATALRTLLDALAEKGQIIDLGAAFKQAQEAQPAAPADLEAQTATVIKNLSPSPSRTLACPLATVHHQMTIPCPSCRAIPGVGKPAAPSET